MPLPIVAVDPFGAKKRLLGMDLARKDTFDTEIGAEADALVLSRHALIGGVEQAENNIVFGMGLAGGMALFRARTVILSSFVVGAPGSLDTSLFRLRRPESTVVWLEPGSGTPVLRPTTSRCICDEVAHCVPHCLDVLKNPSIDCLFFEGAIEPLC